MATGDTTTKNAVAASAFQFDMTANPALIPAACIVDGYDGRLGMSEGYKVLTGSGRYVFPVSGDWIVTKSGKTFVLDNTTFTALFNTPSA